MALLSFGALVFELEACDLDVGLRVSGLRVLVLERLSAGCWEALA
jgi:hypothetical protein